jgi:RNA polymerase sigma factor (sigma-70 family)
MDAERELVSKCLNRELASQSKLYHMFAPAMFGICLRYAGNQMEAEDIMQNGFLRVFHNLHQFRFNGPLEAWVKRTIVNTAVNFCKHNAKFQKEVELKEFKHEATFSVESLSMLSTNDLLAIVQGLPAGHRTVFNLFVIEGYGHKEISGMLGISEGTSKSQLYRAKASIRQRLKELEKV